MHISGFVAAAAVLCACALAGSGPACADPAEQAVSDDAAYYVIEVGPADTALIIEPGRIENGAFSDESHFSWLGPDPKKPDEGFIVAKATGDQPMGIVSVGFETPTSVFRQGLFGLMLRDIKHSAGDKDYTQFDFCTNRPTFVFRPEPHRVLYITSLDFTFRADRSFLLGGRDKLEINSHGDIEKARAYLAKKNPELAERLEQGTYDRYPLNRVCPL